MSKETPEVEVSILIPSFNSSPYISDAVRSALDQAGCAIEAIVQDGGSTDGTLETLRSIRDPRLSLTVESDDGQSDALNRALGRAVGQFVIWLNGDDMLMPGAVEALLRAAREQEFEVVHGNFESIDTEGLAIKRYRSASLDTERLIRHGVYVFSGAILIRRSLLLTLGGFDTDLHYCMDYELMFRIARTSSAKGKIPDVVAGFRIQPTSKTESTRFAPFREGAMVARRHGATRLDIVRRAAVFFAYVLLRPVWRSRAWIRIRPSKHLGAAAG